MTWNTGASSCDPAFNVVTKLTSFAPSVTGLVSRSLPSIRKVALVAPIAVPGCARQAFEVLKARRTILAETLRPQHPDMRTIADEMEQQEALRERYARKSGLLGRGIGVTGQLAIGLDETTDRGLLGLRGLLRKKSDL